MKSEGLLTIKTGLVTGVSVCGGAVIGLLGGWDIALKTLIILMAVDYSAGMLIAGVFKESPKTESGTLESRAGFKGLCRKGMILVLVLVAYHLDQATGTDFIRSTVIVGFIANESLSVIENAGLMGIPIPSILRKAIDALRTETEEKEVR